MMLSQHWRQLLRCINLLLLYACKLYAEWVKLWVLCGLHVGLQGVPNAGSNVRRGAAVEVQLCNCC
jgi:hypothetical protein